MYTCHLARGSRRTELYDPSKYANTRERQVFSSTDAKLYQTLRHINFEQSIILYKLLFFHAKRSYIDSA